MAKKKPTSRHDFEPGSFADERQKRIKAEQAAKTPAQKAREKKLAKEFASGLRVVTAALELVRLAGSKAEAHKVIDGLND